MINVANAPCSWGVIENIAGERGGYALVLDEMHETGYVGTELGDWGFMPTDPEKLRQELEARNLKLLASWVSVYLPDPSVLGLCFDTGHYRFGGGDPVEGLQQHADRIWHVHFKDHDPKVAEQSRRKGWDGVESVAHGVFCELGRGDVDFPAVLAKLNELNYQGWIVVEQDVLPGMGSPKASAQHNRDYLRSIGL